MKIKTTAGRRVPGVGSRTPADGVVRPSPRSGFALIVTLILLAVTLLMTVAFLALSTRERTAAATSTDAATARLATEAALNAAQAQIAANVLSSTNPFSFGLLVSTNHDANDSAANLPNLFISPRVPVWLSNTVTHAMEDRFYLDLNRNGRDDPNGWVPNVNSSGNVIGPDVFEVGDPEWIGLLEHPDQPYGVNNPYVARFAFLAVPEGNALDLNAIYNQVLDENNPNPTVNPAADSSGNVGEDFFFRNQGVGSWELNLAAFLADLNADEWPTYAYNEANPTNAFPNSGAAGDDARAMLAYRYANNYDSLASVDSLFGGQRGRSAASAAFLKDNIDGYSDGPLQTGFESPGDINGAIINDKPTLPWAGADNTNQFFDLPADLFDPSKTAVGVQPGTVNFSQRLQAAGTNAATYDRYTFYRLLSQMGSESAPESGLMNLNYDNLDPGFNGLPATNGAASETNFVPWQPLTFFLNAADRILKAYTAQWATTYVPVKTGPNATNLVAALNPDFVATFNVTNAFGVTDIPVWVGNRYVYTPAVQRLLQLAANIYEATSTNYYPSVFRPVFERDNFGNVFIAGYAQVASVTGPADPQLAAPVDVASLASLAPTSGTPIVDANGNLVNVYGVPWIIGAKKGFPNFNSFSMESIFSLTRKLKLTRPSTSDTFASNPNAYTFAQQLTVGLTNYLQVQCWNSYRADYIHAQPMVIYATDWNSVVLTNDEGVVFPVSTFNPYSAYTNNGIPPNPMTVSDWPGYGPGLVPQQTSFLIPLQAGNVQVPNSVYTFNPAQPFTPDPNAYFTNITMTPQWGLLTTNRLRVVMLEHNPADQLYHVIDYAQLMGPDGGHDLSADIQRLYDTQVNAYYDDQWDPNLNNNVGVLMAAGIGNQFTVSAGLTPVIQDPYWAQQDLASVQNQIAVFRGFLGLGQTVGSYQSYNLGKLSLWQQAPYSPTALVAYITQWGANDPLVHYLASDLTDLNASTAAQAYSVAFPTGVLNNRYRPWGGNPEGYDPYPYDSALKDPLVLSSDSWDFPTNKLATVGWLGRVHRGTPWQSVYLKSTDVLATPAGLNAWMNVTGDANPYDAANMAPAQDRLLFDLFTTAFDDNATRGTLSVNAGAGSPDPASDLAAWSAVFSSMVVPTNFFGGYTVISPAGLAGLNSPLGTLVTNINFTRYYFRNPDGLTGVFEHKGDILAAPALTEQSPFLAAARLNPNTQISDEMLEWLPQQMLSLLRDSSSPRYVIYAYGQALKPAPAPENGIFVGGSYLATNYQVTAESAMREAVRIETARTNVFTGTNYTITVTPPHAVIENFSILPPD